MITTKSEDAGIDTYVSDFGVHRITATEWVNPDCDPSERRWERIDTDGEWLENRLCDYIQIKWSEGLDSSDYDISEAIRIFVMSHYADRDPRGFKINFSTSNGGSFTDSIDLLVGGDA